MRRVLVVAGILGLMLGGCGEEKPRQETMKKADSVRDVTKATAMLTVASPAFGPGGRIPKKYTGEGENLSPPLEWSGAPEGTEEFALICDDPDAPRPEPWVHWVLYGIPAGVTSLAEGGNGGAVEGTTSRNRPGYGGPMPPPGHGVHHYHFRVYALDTTLDLPPGATKEQLLKAMAGHLLAEGELVGTYDR